MHRLFPIKANEAIKFFVLASLFFFICLNNHILRNLKETVVITNPQLGIHAIPFIKTWLMLPIIFLFVKLYVYLSGRFAQETVTYIILSAILAYFVLFIAVLLPHDQLVQLHCIGDWIPFATCGEVVRHWNIALYYCMSEIWGTVVMMILFWGTCNRSTDIDQAKRFYSPILAISNLSGLASAQLSISCSSNQLKHVLFPEMTNWNATLSTLTLLVSLLTICILGLFYVLHRHILKGEVSRVETQTKKSISLFKAIRYIATDYKFRALAFTIFAYYFCSGILELILKHHLHTIYTDSNAFNDILNWMTVCVSITSTLVTTFITGKLIQRCASNITALITPLLLIVPLSILIFSSAIGAGVSAIVCAVYFMLSRMCKFTFFDLSKEIVNVGCSHDEQVSSKPVLDGIVPKLAKTSESLFLQLLMTICVDLTSAIPFVILLTFVIHLLWIYAVPLVNKTHAHEGI